MTRFEILKRVERFAAGAWLAAVAWAHSDAGVAFPLWMICTDRGGTGTSRGER